MRGLICLAWLFFAQITLAQDLVPGTYRIEYGGVYKIIARESSRFFENQWKEQGELEYLVGNDSFSHYYRRLSWINDHLYDWEHGSPWYLRCWHHSMEEENGGARRIPIRINYGTTYDIWRTPLFTIDNSFNIKWTKVEARLDLRGPLEVSLGDIPPPSLGFKFNLSPELKFSSRRLLSAPHRAIERVGLTLTCTYYYRRKPTVGVYLQGLWRPNTSEAYLGLQVAMLQW